MKITNQAAIVTGGGSGIGAEVARSLAAAGAKVTLLDLKEDAAKQVAHEIKGLAIRCDVSDSAHVAAALRASKEAHGVARICINCAGIAPAKRVVGKQGPMRLEEFIQVINVNLIGTFNVLRLVADEMSQLEPLNAQGERGIIINTASVAAYEGQIGQAAYSASKGGIVSMTLPIARELAQFGIRVNTIAPGIVETPMLLGLSHAVQESLAQSVPFPKRLGKPEEFARLAMHIIENEYINGTTIRLDGAIRMAPK